MENKSSTITIGNQNFTSSKGRGAEMSFTFLSPIFNQQLYTTSSSASIDDPKTQQNRNNQDSQSNY